MNIPSTASLMFWCHNNDCSVEIRGDGNCVVHYRHKHAPLSGPSAVAAGRMMKATIHVARLNVLVDRDEKWIDHAQHHEPVPE